MKDNESVSIEQNKYLEITHQATFEYLKDEALKHY